MSRILPREVFLKASWSPSCTPYTVSAQEYIMHFFLVCTRDITPSLLCPVVAMDTHSLEWDNAESQPRQLCVDSPEGKPGEDRAGTIQGHQLKKNKVKELHTTFWLILVTDWQKGSSASGGCSLTTPGGNSAPSPRFSSHRGANRARLILTMWTKNVVQIKIKYRRQMFYAIVDSCMTW